MEGSILNVLVAIFIYIPAAICLWFIYRMIKDKGIDVKLDKPISKKVHPFLYWSELIFWIFCFIIMAILGAVFLYFAFILN